MSNGVLLYFETTYYDGSFPRKNSYKYIKNIAFIFEFEQNNISKNFHAQRLIYFLYLNVMLHIYMECVKKPATLILRSSRLLVIYWLNCSISDFTLLTKLFARSTKFSGKPSSSPYSTPCG